MSDAIEVVEAVASDMIKAVARPAKRTSELASIFLPAGSTSKRQKTSDAPASPFSLPAFRDGLSTKGTAPTEADLLALECDTLHESWLALLAPELRKDYFLAMKRSLWAQGVHGKDTPVKTTGVFPPARDIYSWSQLPLTKVKCVILGQDPYHNVGQAHGLAFSVRPGVPVPPSLKNIYKEVKNDYPDFVLPKHGYLDAWQKEGVLCLNTALTVKAHEANSHSKIGWEAFTDAVIQAINKQGGSGLSEADGGVVFLAWGNSAIKRMAKIDKRKHLVLTSVHPSPLSANKGPGFFGHGHFKKANAWLRERHGAEIDWCSVSQAPVASEGQP